MANYDMSLDEIIHNRKGGKFGGPRFNNRRGNNRRQDFAREKGFDLKSKLQNRRFPDARLKIIGKQRAQVHDARDRLNMIAKQTDARQRLQKLKAIKSSNRRPPAAQASVSVTRTVSNDARSWRENVQNRTLLANNRFQRISRSPAMKTANRFLSTGPSFPRTVGRGGFNKSRLGIQSIGERSQNTNLGMFSARLNNNRIISNNRNLTVVTSNNAINRKSFNESDDDEDMEPPLMHNFGITKRVKTLETTDLETLGPFSSHLSASLKSRLSPMESASPLQGYKVVVTNLLTNVSQDDIQELFSEIGPLRRAMLTRRGVAEVVFYELSDALKACEVYHNRQLDGKPMSVKLVTATSGQNVPSDERMDVSSSSRAKVSPDIDIIRRALFHKGTSNSSASQQPLFTITMAKN